MSVALIVHCVDPADLDPRRPYRKVKTKCGRWILTAPVDEGGIRCSHCLR